MQKITFIKQEDGSLKYAGRIERRKDTFEKVKDTLIEVEISDEDFEKVEFWGCEISFSDGKISITNSQRYLEKYKNDRYRNYPPIEDYLDAKVKQASENEEVRQNGIAQEQEYIKKCLEVKEKYPK